MAKKKIEENRQAILDLLLNKAALKQNIAHDVSEVFKQFKGLIKDEIESLKIHVWRSHFCRTEPMIMDT